MKPRQHNSDLLDVRISGTTDYFDLYDWNVYSEEFRKKPVVIKALRLELPVEIETLEGVMRGDVGDWLICGINGEFYPCKHDVFKQTYEKVK